jgi:hypothetical protein
MNTPPPESPVVGGFPYRCARFGPFREMTTPLENLKSTIRKDHEGHEDGKISRKGAKV